jgi:hypothetical protein
MSVKEDIIELVREMDESEAKATLAKIFVKLERINNYNYPKTKALEDIFEIYREKIVGHLIFGKSENNK